MRENNGKSTVGTNEFADFEKFGLEHPDRTKTMLAMKPANHLGVRITLETTALRVTL